MLCRLCQKEEIKPLFIIPNACPNISYLPTEPIEMEARDLPIWQCPKCGFVQLSEENKDCVEYDDYFMAASLSKQMQECQEQQAQVLKDISEMLRPQTSKVFEIGCGDGSFLRHLIDKGFIVSAIEPSKRFYEHAIKICPDIKNEYMSDNIQGAPYDIVVAREVLEHVYDFNTFLKQTFKIINNNSGLLMIQVPRLETAIDDCRMHTFFTDHVNYFSERTLSLALELNGFIVLDVKPYMGGEYTVAIARKRTLSEHNTGMTGWRIKIWKLKEYIDKNLSAGKKIVFWGAGGKGLSILSAIEAKPSKALSLVDCDVMKINRYTPVTNFLIQDSAKISEIKPDIIIILADAYRDEITKKIKNFNGVITYPGDLKCES